MAALASTRHNPVLGAFYQRLRAQGKVAKTALIAVARTRSPLADAEPRKLVKKTGLAIQSLCEARTRCLTRGAGWNGRNVRGGGTPTRFLEDSKPHGGQAHRYLAIPLIASSASSNACVPLRP